MNGASPSSLAHVLTAVESAATIAFALSGLLEAARKRLDAVGVCIVAGLAAFGGGTLRDMVLDRRPFFWVQHAGWLWALLELCVLAMIFMRATSPQLSARCNGPTRWASDSSLPMALRSHCTPARQQ